MKSVFIFLLALSSLCCNAQQAQTDTAKYYYCEMQTLRKPISNKYNVYVDFGTTQKFLNDTSYSWLLGTGNKMALVQSIIEPLNFMGSKGWRCVLRSQPEASQGFELVTYLLEKRE